MINAILDIIILVGIVVDFLYIRGLEEDNKVLKEWIKFCYHIDLDRLTEFVERSKTEPQTDTITFTYTEEEWNEIQDWKDQMWAEAVKSSKTEPQKKER